jgi:cytochrome c oxidase subunit 2
MLVTGTSLSLSGLTTVAQASENPVAIFDNLYTAFLILGTLVGIVVISYIVYNAWTYRSEDSTEEGQYDIEETHDEESVARPQLGEVPTGVGKAGGKKLFVSFAISAIAVLSLITFAYWNLLLVEGTPDDANDMEVDVVANQFNYTYDYPGGENAAEVLRVPTDRVITLNVTSCHSPGTLDRAEYTSEQIDSMECPNVSEGEVENVGNVWHSWSSPDLRASGDAIPGQYTETWFVADEPGTYRVVCRELCGSGHSSMNIERGVIALEDSEFENWCLENDCMAEDELTSWLDETEGES